MGIGRISFSNNMREDVCENILTIFHKCGYNTTMPYYDEVFKHITAEFPNAVAGLALKTSEIEVGERLGTEQPTVQMHHSDMAFHVRLPDEEAILHIEAQTDDSARKPMHLRMLAYSSFLALEHEKNVYSTVLYFRPPAGRRDKGIYEYGDAQRGGVRFQYTVIRLYELEGESFLDSEAVGLLPFTALMKPPPDMTSHAWIEKCIETTQMADVDNEMRATLLFGLSVFGSLAHPPEHFQNPILEEIMQESPIIERFIQRGVAKGVEQGIEQGIAQGQTRAKREAVLKLLRHRFGDIPQSLATRIAAMQHISQLDALFEKVMVAETLEDVDL